MKETTYSTVDGFDYETFHFSADFPIPDVYVVAAGAAYFHGPDECLWFAPMGSDGVQIEWGWASNVAEFDARMTEEVGADLPGYGGMVTALCRAVDAARDAEQNQTRR